MIIYKFDESIPQTLIIHFDHELTNGSWARYIGRGGPYEYGGDDMRQGKDPFWITRLFTIKGISKVYIDQFRVVIEKAVLIDLGTRKTQILTIIQLEIFNGGEMQEVKQQQSTSATEGMQLELLFQRSPNYEI